MTKERGLLEELIGDGRPALALTAVALFLSGVFAVFLAVRREFLPHDVAFLQMSAAELCAIADCRVVHFMLHDRVAFGGTLIAVAILYLWLIAFPAQGSLWPVPSSCSSERRTCSSPRISRSWGCRVRRSPGSAIDSSR